MASAKVYKNFIGGEWVESRTGRTFENQNPADTRDIVGIFQASDQRDVDDAVAAVVARARGRRGELDQHTAARRRMEEADHAGSQQRS